MNIVYKFVVKEYGSNLLGEDYLIKTIGVWNRFDDIDFDWLFERFVLKTTHDLGGVMFIKKYGYSIYIDENVQVLFDILPLYQIAKESKCGIAMHILSTPQVCI